jgi:hypothetical protein
MCCILFTWICCSHFAHGVCIEYSFICLFQISMNVLPRTFVRSDHPGVPTRLEATTVHAFMDTLQADSIVTVQYRYAWFKFKSQNVKDYYFQCTSKKLLTNQYHIKSTRANRTVIPIVHRTVQLLFKQSWYFSPDGSLDTSGEHVCLAFEQNSACSSGSPPVRSLQISFWMQLELCGGLSEILCKYSPVLRPTFRVSLASVVWPGLNIEPYYL